MWAVVLLVIIAVLFGVGLYWQEFYLFPGMEKEKQETDEWWIKNDWNWDDPRIREITRKSLARDIERLKEQQRKRDRKQQHLDYW